MDRLFCAALALLLIPLDAMPQAPKSVASPSQRARKLAALLDEAARYPVEYHAAVLFSAMDNAPALLSPQQQRQRLQTVFERASEATFRSDFLSGGLLGQTLLDEEALSLVAAPVSTVAIQVAVVDRLLPLAPAQAGELFRSIALPAASISCETAAVPVARSYFEAWTKLAAKPQTGLALADAAAAVNSPGALLDYLDALGPQTLNREEWAETAGRLAHTLNGLQPTDRELNAVEHFGELSTAMGAVLAKMRDSHAQTAGVVGAYRGFLSRGLSGERCTDSTLDRAKVVSAFDVLRKPDPVPALDVKEIAGKPGRAAKLDPLPLDPAIVPLAHPLFDLSDRNRERRYREHADSDLQPDPEGVKQILDLTRVDYDKSDVCQLCRFEQRRGLLDTLYIVVPPGPSSREIIHEYIRFLELNQAEDDCPSLWLPSVQMLLNTSRPPDKAAEKALEKEALAGHNLLYIPSGEARTIRELFAASPDPIIQFLWRAELLLRPPYKPFLPPPAM